MKKCNKCGKVKPLTDFARRPCNADGKTSHCKQCILDYTNKRLAEKKLNKQFEII